MTNPEQVARQQIDQQLEAAGWQVQDYQRLNLLARRGVAVREFPLKTGWADYLLLVDGKAIGAVEAKKVGTTLSGIAHQSAKYSTGLPALPKAWHKPLPFLYESTGVETNFTNLLDPEPRSRRVFSFHRPETLAEWAGHLPTLRGRLRDQLPPLLTAGLWEPQIEAILNLERSLAADKPRALIQMATGSGKTFTAVSAIYRLIKFGRARRVLFLVDRSNLGRQALREFQQYITPDDGRKFTELYNVQLLTSNVLDPVSRVCITTIQRLYSILRGEAEFDPALETQSMAELESAFGSQPKTVTYNEGTPVEYFDFLFPDECHRSIYNLWRQVLDYFDAYIIGLTATPAKQTLGFFNQNLVMEYSRQRAVADGINVDGTVYRIRTRITEEGSQIEAGYVVEKRDRLSRQLRLEQLDEELVYPASQLDTQVIAESQIRTIMRTFRDKLPEMFPGRTEVPKTIIFAKDDSHAEDIVRIVREEFGRGNEFCQKITYKVSGVNPEELIAAFRNSYNPRIAVTVDMIATGTDIKPVEIIFFMRLVKSWVLFEQMIGRGTRVISPTDLQAVTSDATIKDRFVIVDAVGVIEHPKVHPQSLEHQPTVPFKKLLAELALGADDAETLETLAGRLARLRRRATPQDEYEIAAASGGLSLHALITNLLEATDPDRCLAAAQAESGQEAPSPEQIEQTGQQLRQQTAQIFMTRPELRQVLQAIHERSEQVIDRISLDEVREARFSADDTERARGLIESFRQFIEEHKDEITALQLIYNQPQSQQRLTLPHIKALAEAISRNRPAWTTEALWNAYTRLQGSQARGAGGPRVLTDLISLVRCVVQLEDELVPYPERVQQRYQEWLAAQTAAGRDFTPAQQTWLDQIAEAVGVNLSVTPTDLNDQFHDQGGLVAARRLFGAALPGLLEELNEVLVS